MSFDASQTSAYVEFFAWGSTESTEQQVVRDSRRRASQIYTTDTVLWLLMIRRTVVDAAQLVSFITA